MFNSLNDEIRKHADQSETPRSRFMLYAGAIAGAVAAMWGLYAAVLYLE